LAVVMVVVLAEVAALFVLHSFKAEELSVQQRKNAELTSQIEQAKRNVANHEQVKTELALLRARETAIQKLQSGRSGPTAILMELARILTPGRGEVTVSGLPVSGEHLREIRRRVGIVFQDPDDQLFMGTVRADVGFGPANLGLAGAELDSRVMHALDLVGMADFADRPPHHLSFGQRRRVAVATVLAMEPEILVLDEPSSNLDPASRRELADIVRSLDVTVLMVTHDLPYALELCPRSLILHDGTVVADGATYDVLTDDALMSAHRLELPFGFDPRTVGRPEPRG
jgi:cobalt/nickel transport system ATP-binding protein